MGNCKHNAVPGPRVNAQHGTSATEVCAKCLAYRTVLHSPGRWTVADEDSPLEVSSWAALQYRAEIEAEARSDERAKVLAKIEAIVAAPAPVAWRLLDELRVYLRGQKP